MQESPTLDLTDDCSRFVTRHFEIISTSSPHIYHSALPLTPRESIVRKLYESHARPFARVVCGVPMLWDSKAAVATFGFDIQLAVWSPCSRFIAVFPEDTATVDILDPATLQRIQSLNIAQTSSLLALAFSPDSRMLTSFIHKEGLGTAGAIVSWDLQTGGVVSTIEQEGLRDVEVRVAHITYSMNGKMVAVLFQHGSSSISIYDVISGVSMARIAHGAHTELDLDSGALCVCKIWAHGESLRFATPRLTGFTIWEVGFMSGATPMEVESVSVPSNVTQAFTPWQRGRGDIKWTKSHPASYRFASVDTAGTLSVWDTRASEFLLRRPGTIFCPPMSFSSDARFFACATEDSEIYLWKESPTGYTLFEKFTPGTRQFESKISPNGESIIVFDGSMIQLWYMNSFASTTSTILAPVPRYRDEPIVLEFFPNRPLAIAARMGNEMVIVIDLESGALQLTIDTSMLVYGLTQIGNTVVAIGGGGAVAWNIPGGDFLPNARMGVKDSTWKINLGQIEDHLVTAASISSDFQCVVRSSLTRGVLDVYYTSTRQNLVAGVQASALWFAPSGHDVWCVLDDKAKVFTVTQDGLHHTSSIANIEDGSWGCPWGSQRGYKVTHDGWILSGSGKRLLMLPPLWRSEFKEDRVWNWKFLALLHRELHEPVILELEP
jgi:WD40 repeat protein